MMSPSQQNIIIYNTADGKASVKLYAQDGMVWMNQNQLAELFDTSKQNIGQHITNILNENEISENSVVKNYFTTAADGKEYKVAHYALEMILAIGFRMHSKRGVIENKKSYTLCSLLSWTYIRLLMRTGDAKARTLYQTFLNRNSLRTELSPMREHKLLTREE